MSKETTDNKYYLAEHSNEVIILQAVDKDLWIKAPAIGYPSTVASLLIKQDST